MHFPLLLLSRAPSLPLLRFKLLDRCTEDFAAKLRLLTAAAPTLEASTLVSAYLMALVAFATPLAAAVELEVRASALEDALSSLAWLWLEVRTDFEVVEELIFMLSRRVVEEAEVSVLEEAATSEFFTTDVFMAAPKRVTRPLS